MRKRPCNLLGKTRPCTSQELERWHIYRMWRDLADNLPNIPDTEHLRSYSHNRANRLKVPLGYADWAAFESTMKEWEKWA